MKYITAFLITIATVLVLPQYTAAAEYSVNSCGEFLRRPLPATNWTLVGSPEHFQLYTDCAAGPTTLVGTDAPPGTEGGIRFSVKRPLAIVGMHYRALIHAPASINPPNNWWWDIQGRATSQDGRTRMTGICPGRDNMCNEQYWATSRTIELDRLLAYGWVLICNRESQTPCLRGDAQLLDATFRIDDPVQPRILGYPGGAIFQGIGPVSGTQTIPYQVVDDGSGVYRVVLEVDGSVAAEDTFEMERPTCKRPFVIPQPCPARANGALVFDTARHVDGEHQARLLVYDASDQNVAVYGPVSYTSRNQTLDSYCASVDPRRLKIRTPRHAVRFGRSWHLRGLAKDARGWEAVVLSGRAKVEALHHGLISDSGTYEVRIPRGPSRTVRFGVRPQGSVGKFVCSAPRMVRVRGRISLRVKPRHVRVGRAIVIAGRLFGLGRARKAVVVQARAVGSKRWATVRVLRTGQSGRYKMRYRFRSSFGRVTYVFRSQVQAERGYPYVTGTSAKRRVLVTG